MEITQYFYVLNPGNDLRSGKWLVALSRSSEVTVIIDGMIYVQRYTGLLNSVPKI